MGALLFTCAVAVSATPRFQAAPEDRMGRVDPDCSSHLTDSTPWVRLTPVNRHHLSTRSCAVIEDTPIRIYRPTSSPTDDPLLMEQWHLDQSTAVSGPSPAPIDRGIGWVQAVNETSSSARIVRVALIDTGVDLDHPDLVDVLWSNPGELANNGVDDDGNGYVDDTQGYDFVDDDPQAQDEHGHGTQVAGALAAVSNNALGIAGVASNVELVPLRVLAPFGNTLGVVAAIDYAIAVEAELIQASFVTDDFDPMLEDALERARAAGCVVVTAAGNDSRYIETRPVYPASFDNDRIVV
ncbi:MAG: S8 family serine peptidase, partial [Myxococcota bacterium]